MKTGTKIVSLLALLALHIACLADELFVPGQYPTIQAAIDDSNDGDIIIVADGTYTGEGNRDIDFLGKAITLRSENGAESSIIDSEGTGVEPHRGFYFRNGEDANSVLEGFTIMGGHHTDNTTGGIRCNESSPTIANCIITDNKGGIGCYKGGPTITNCAITGNEGNGQRVFNKRSALYRNRYGKNWREGATVMK